MRMPGWIEKVPLNMASYKISGINWAVLFSVSYRPLWSKVSHFPGLWMLFTDIWTDCFKEGADHCNKHKKKTQKHPRISVTSRKFLLKANIRVVLPND